MKMMTIESEYFSKQKMVWSLNTYQLEAIYAYAENSQKHDLAKAYHAMRTQLGLALLILVTSVGCAFTRIVLLMQYMHQENAQKISTTRSTTASVATCA